MKDPNTLSISGASLEKTALEGVFILECPTPPDTEWEAILENVDWGYGVYQPEYAILWRFHKVIWEHLESVTDTSHLPLVPVEDIDIEEIGSGYLCEATLQITEEDFRKLPPLVRQLLTYKQPTAINTY